MLKNNFSNEKCAIPPTTEVVGFSHNCMKGIKEKRLQLGKKQIDVAKECNVGMTTVYLWDKGDFKSMREENRALLKKCLKLNDNELPPVWKYSRKGE